MCLIDEWYDFVMEAISTDVKHFLICITPIEVWSILATFDMDNLIAVPITPPTLASHEWADIGSGTADVTDNGINPCLLMDNV